ncbi:MAG: hypothetical protein P8X52_07925, partial [Limibacillus sp.]
EKTADIVPNHLAGIAVADVIDDKDLLPVVEKRYPDIGHAGLLLALSKPLRDSAPVLADMTAFLRA